MLSFSANKVGSKLTTKKSSKVRMAKRSYATKLSGKDAVIISAVRTPIGSFGGALASQNAIQLGSVAVIGALNKAGIKGDQVDEVILGNVCSANLGQSPARQVMLASGIPNTTDCFTINKVCASGLKTVGLASQSIQLGQSGVVLAGGFESMSNIPYYVPNIRFGGLKYGDGGLIDGLARDGLSDAYDGSAMGKCGDVCSKKYNISRQAQDDWAIQSYKKSADSTSKGYFKEEIVPVEIKGKKGESTFVSEDEEFKKVVFEKIPTLRAAFSPDGTVTAANASKINDGASAFVMSSYEKAGALGLKPIARVVGYADAATEPVEFTVAPSLAIPKALKMAGLKVEDIDLWEINEAFAVVALVNAQLLNIPLEKLNVFGGAVALGHPIGGSGARILTTLIHSLQRTNKKYGVASICNGGGGATAVVVEAL